MKPLILALAASLALAGAAAAEPSKTADVTDTSFATADGARTLQQSVIIDAPAAALWKAFADTQEFKRWNAPVAAVDLRVGGVQEASYDPKRALGDPDNIKNRIVTFLPGRLIVFQNIQAPHGLPRARRSVPEDGDGGAVRAAVAGQDPGDDLLHRMGHRRRVRAAVRVLPDR